jgi:hypothetical protein
MHLTLGCQDQHTQCRSRKQSLQGASGCSVRFICILVSRKPELNSCGFYGNTRHLRRSVMLLTHMQRAIILACGSSHSRRGALLHNAHNSCCWWPHQKLTLSALELFIGIPMLPPTSIHSSAATRGCLCSHCSDPIGLLANALLGRAPCFVAISGDPSMAATRYACLASSTDNSYLVTQSAYRHGCYFLNIIQQSIQMDFVAKTAPLLRATLVLKPLPSDTLVEIRG